MKDFDNLTNNKLRNVLRKLDEKAYLERFGKRNIPVEDKMWAITRDTGIFFNIMLKAMHAKKILEVGTSVGYSTLWFADAIIQNSAKSEKTHILTIERNPSKIERACKNFREAGVEDLVEIRKGDAKKILRDISKELKKEFFDFAFIDTDKENYVECFDLILPLVRIGGIIAADNILFPKRFQSLTKKYVDYVKSKSNVQTVTVKIGRGEELTLRIA